MAFGSAVHGVNGLVYVSAAEVEGANAFVLNINTDAADYVKFGDSWRNQVAGVSEWSGSISGVHDQDSKKLQDAVTARASVAVLLYPKRSDLTTYYSGNAVFTGVSHDVSVDGVETLSADFVGDSTLTLTGFAA